MSLLSSTLTLLARNGKAGEMMKVEQPNRLLRDIVFIDEMIMLWF